MIMKELFAIVNTSLSGTGAWDLLKSHLVHILTFTTYVQDNCS